MKKSQALELLKKNPVFWSRLGFCYDPPLKDEEGKPLVFEKDFSFYIHSHDMMADAGIRIHTSILHSGWVGVDEYDYSLADRVVESIFASGKVDYYIPRIKLNVPVDWCRKYPEEVCVYFDGPRDREGILSLVGGLRQDYLGYDSKVGYYNRDTRPNTDGLISMQSFSSAQWLKDAGQALTLLVKHLEEGPYGEKILAYHIAFGACGESMPWGRESGRFGDYGIANQRNFAAWGLEKYGSGAALEQAWGKKGGDTVPPPEDRESRSTDESGWYRNDTSDRRALDYDRFTADCNVNAIEHFAKLIHSINSEKPVGAFYGYILFMSRSAYAGHLGWQKLLECPDVDFFAAPKSYNRSAPGQPGGEMAPTVGVNRRKLWIDECDNRTHLTVGDNHENASTPEQTYAVHLRELCKNVSHDSGLWYMDLGKGWFDDIGIIQNLQKLMAFSNRLRATPHTSVTEILVIADENSLLHTNGKVIRPLENSLRNLQLCGVPLDEVFIQDLPYLDTSRIKLAVLLHPAMMSDANLRELKASLPADCRLVLMGKPLENAGFQWKPVNGTLYPSYMLKVGSAAASAPWTAVACNEYGDYAVGQLPLSTCDARKIAGDAGVHFYAPEGCAVYADNRLLSFFPSEDMEFTCNLPQTQSLIPFDPMKYGGIQGTDSLHIKLRACEGAAFAVTAQ